jgi:dTDP-glucose 4,6-dehydratase
MRVLVTGAAGFLGSHLSDRFLSEGYSVVGVDNFLTGHSQNLAHLGDDPRFEFIEADVSERIPDVGPVDGVLHLASPASPVDYLAYPVSTMKVGSFGTFNALELARRHGARFFLASTSEVYGDPLEHPQVESYWGHVNPVGPRSVYDEAKRFSEALTMSYHREFGLETRIVRIFNTYGPRMRPRDGRVVTNFIVQALNGEPITVYGDGTQTRSFCYVSDEIEGLFRLFERGDHHPTNIGNPREHTMLELATIVVELTGTSSPVVFEALPQDDPRQRCPNITRARELLGWEPRVDVRDGIALTIDYFRALMGTERMQARA